MQTICTPQMLFVRSTYTVYYLAKTRICVFLFLVTSCSSIFSGVAVSVPFQLLLSSTWLLPPAYPYLQNINFSFEVFRFPRHVFASLLFFKLFLEFLISY